MLCTVCGKEVNSQSAFCPHCGAPVAAAPVDTAGYAPVSTGYAPVNSGAGVPPPGYGAQPGVPPPGYPAQPGVAGSGLSDGAASALAYITIIPAIIFLVLEPYNKVPLIRFHSFQSIGLCVAAVCLQIVLTILQIVLHVIPLIGLLFIPVHLLVGLGLFVLWLLCILKASKGEWYKLPVIGDFAEKQARS
jgi:uncharacterized membrane protein